MLTKRIQDLQRDGDIARLRMLAYFARGRHIPQRIFDLFLEKFQRTVLKCFGIVSHRWDPWLRCALRPTNSLKKLYFRLENLRINFRKCRCRPYMYD